MICPWTYKMCVHTLPICGADGSIPFQAMLCTHDPHSSEKMLRLIREQKKLEAAQGGRGTADATKENRPY